MSGISVANMDFAVSILERGEFVRGIEALVDADLADGTLALKLQFDTACLCVSVQEQDDTVEFLADWPRGRDNDVSVRVVTHRGLESLLIGKKLAWIWRMENHLRFVDAVQLEFGGEPEQKVAVQLIAAASTLDVRLVGPEMTRTFKGERGNE